ncbi:MAG TPA: Type 1 glutamine amidotransferase-like domain-containing protein [Anaeromyxobacter sp.]|nr:Type 1 glutamine amidotransferase-like domain-containing protein [Anaeromyxobacter sp.]
MGAQPIPVHLLAGGPGARRNAYRALVQDILSLSGKRRPVVAYLGAATDDDPRFGGWMKDLVASAGPCAFRLAPVSGGRASTARQIIEEADVVFVGGGDVELGMQRIGERDLAGALRRKHAGGVPFFGISAGAIMLARRWVRWPDPDDEHSVEAFDCLGLAPVLCDCHGEEDGWGELKALLRLSGAAAVGYGLRSGAAVRVGPGDAVETVCGAVDRFAVRGGKVLAG